ncbi:MAG: hypothetical protein KatS3mg059_0955 [Thermomicrobiales bacterium]|nr:MAG: hypothetical protein KatS3mg059_0955 [Thermomicrobiales bacterium]
MRVAQPPTPDEARSLASLGMTVNAHSRPVADGMTGDGRHPLVTTDENGERSLAPLGMTGDALGTTGSRLMPAALDTASK